MVVSVGVGVVKGETPDACIHCRLSSKDIATMNHVPADAMGEDNRQRVHRDSYITQGTTQLEVIFPVSMAVIGTSIDNLLHSPLI